MTFSELKSKDVVNICDGRKLGKPIDIVLGEHACAEALVVPAPCGLARFFSKEREGVVIPWNRIKRIGDDVILVEVDPGIYE